MEAHLAPTQPTQVNKITTSCKICGGSHDTQYCMEDPEQAFVEYASSRTDEAGGLVSNFMASQDAKLSKFEADFKQQQSEMTNKIDSVLKVITDRIAGALPGDTVKNPKLSTSPVLSARSSPYLRLVHQSSDTEVVCIKGDDEEVMFFELIRKNDDSSKGEPEEDGSTTTEGEPHHHGRVPINPQDTMQHWKKAYIDPNSPLNIMTRMMYNWIMRRKLNLRENSNRGVRNFTGKIKGMHVFVGNFTYIVDFMIVEDISSIIDLRLSQVVVGKPFVEISNMTHDSPEGVVRFTNGTDEVAYKMPHMIEQYNSLSDLEKEHTKSVYHRNEEDKRRGVKRGGWERMVGYEGGRRMASSGCGCEKGEQKPRERVEELVSGRFGSFPVERGMGMVRLSQSRMVLRLSLCNERIVPPLKFMATLAFISLSSIEKKNRISPDSQNCVVQWCGGRELVVILEKSVERRCAVCEKRRAEAYRIKRRRLI
ncbi:hypothetical protein Tco_0498750 [Tanacetum coccineum]